MARDRRLVFALVAALAVSLAGLVAVADLGELPGKSHGGPGFESVQSADASSGSVGLSPRGLDMHDPPELLHAHAFPAGTGDLPTRSEAMEFAKRYSSFRARGDDGIAELADEGHLTGSGTLADPYVLERFYVDGDLIVESAGKPLILREGYVTGQLKLNYVGSALLVHHVYAKDLRVNENIERGGDDTGGLFHDNEFGFIGQLRHFSGEFRDNVVGPRPQDVVTRYLGDAGLAEVGDGIVFNFDGFHGARVHDNKIIGAVDIKIHGHYHGDCLTCTAHDHADEAHFPDAQEDAHDDVSGDGHDEGDAHAGHDHRGSHHDTASAAERQWLQEKGLRSHHSIRYHSLHFFDNTIEVEEGYALRYYDRAHRADDETANSEPNPYLKDPHVHFQYVWLQGNTMKGGRFALDVFNAADERHVLYNQGVLRIEGNKVHVPYVRESQPIPMALGMDLAKADGIALLVTGNTVRFEEVEDDSIMGFLPAGLERAPELIGLRFNHLDNGNVTITGNTVEAADVGVVAAQFGPYLWWVLEGNTLEADEALRTHNVANPEGASMDDADEEEEEEEEEEDPEADPHHGHGHGGGD